MKKLAEFVIRYRWAVIVFFLALTAFMGFQMKNASFNPDLLTYLPEHLPSRMNQKTDRKDVWRNGYGDDCRTDR